MVRAAFDPLGANVLGSAGPSLAYSDFPGIGAGFFPGAEFPATWYGSALADKRAGADLAVVVDGLPAGFRDISARFSSDFNFYLGLDNNHGAQNDLVTTVLHELGHGLNFITFVDPGSGQNFLGQTDIFARHLVDDSNGLHWNEMTDAQHGELLAFLEGLTGMVVLSGYPSETYDAALKGWRRIEREALADDTPLNALWKLNNAHGARLLMEFMALANHRKEIRSEIVSYAARFGDLEERAVTLAMRAHGVDMAEFPPVVMSMIVTSLARILLLERSLGISRGHAEATEFIERILIRYEMPSP